MKKLALFLIFILALAAVGCKTNEVLTDMDRLAAALEQYDEIADYQDGVIIVKNGELWGLIDKVGTKIKDCVYDNMYFSGDSLIVIEKEGLLGIIGYSGKDVLPCNFADVRVEKATAWGEDLIWAENDYKDGYFDLRGKELIPCKYDKVILDESGIAFVENEGLKGIVSRAGKEILPCEYEAVDYAGGLIAYKSDSLMYTIADATGKVLSKDSLSYVYICDSADVLIAFKDTAFGLLDRNAKPLTEMVYDRIYFPYDSLMVAQKNDTTWLMLDVTGRERFEFNGYYPIFGNRIPEYTETNFDDGLAPVRTDSTFAMIDTNGRVRVVLPEYNSIEPYENGIAQVTSAGLTGYIDSKGRVLVPCNYSAVQPVFSPDGMLESFIVSSNGLKGILSASGKTVAPFDYSYIQPFSAGGFSGYKVGYRERLGLMDKTGKVLLECNYLDIVEDGGLIRVTDEYRQTGFYNTDFVELVPCQLYVAEDWHFSEGLIPFAYIKDQDHFGYLDKSGQIVIDCVYDEAGPFSGGIAKVKKGGLYGFIDRNGGTTLPEKIY